MIFGKLKDFVGMNTPDEYDDEYEEIDYTPPRPITIDDLVAFDVIVADADLGVSFNHKNFRSLLGLNVVSYPKVEIDVRISNVLNDEDYKKLTEANEQIEYFRNAVVGWGYTTTLPEPSAKSTTATTAPEPAPLVTEAPKPKETEPEWTAGDVLDWLNKNEYVDEEDKKTYKNKYSFSLDYSGKEPPYLKDFLDDIKSENLTYYVNTAGKKGIIIREKKNDDGTWAEVNKDDAEKIKNEILEDLKELEQERKKKGWNWSLDILSGTVLGASIAFAMQSSVPILAVVPAVISFGIFFYMAEKDSKTYNSDWDDVKNKLSRILTGGVGNVAGFIAGTAIYSKLTGTPAVITTGESQADNAQTDQPSSNPTTSPSSSPTSAAQAPDWAKHTESQWSGNFNHTIYGYDTNVADTYTNLAHVGNIRALQQTLRMGGASVKANSGTIIHSNNLLKEGKTNLQWSDEVKVFTRNQYQIIAEKFNIKNSADDKVLSGDELKEVIIKNTQNNGWFGSGVGADKETTPEEVLKFLNKLGENKAAGTKFNLDTGQKIASGGGGNGLHLAEMPNLLDNPLTHFLGGSLLATVGAFTGAYVMALFKNRKEDDKFALAKAQVFESRHQVLANVAIGMGVSAAMGIFGVTSLATFPLSIGICAVVGMGARMALNIIGLNKAVEGYVKIAEQNAIAAYKSLENKFALTEEDTKAQIQSGTHEAVAKFIKEKARPLAEALTEKVAEFPSYVVSSVQKVAKLVNNQHQQRIA